MVFKGEIIPPTSLLLFFITFFFLPVQSSVQVTHLTFLSSIQLSETARSPHPLSSFKYLWTVHYLSSSPLAKSSLANGRFGWKRHTMGYSLQTPLSYECFPLNFACTAPFSERISSLQFRIATFLATLRENFSRKG